MRRAVTPKTVEKQDTRPTIEVWVGGDWQRAVGGDVIPVTGHIPNPSAQRQFMAHDENGVRLDHKHGLYGHRPIEDIAGEVCPTEYFEALVEQEVRDVRAFYGDKTDPKYVEDKIKEKVDRMRAKYAERKKTADAYNAAKLSETDAATIAAGEAAKARQKSAMRSEAKGAGA